MPAAANDGDRARLLDRAGGASQIASPLADRFTEVWAVDQEPEPVAFAKAKAEGVTNSWLTDELKSPYRRRRGSPAGS